MFKPGIDGLLGRHRSWLAGRRIGLVTHAAALDAAGCMSIDRFRRAGDLDLCCGFGPEHGFAGEAGAGADCGHAHRSRWGVPLYSLYGRRRGPTPAMLGRVDVLVVDLQDLGARPYTYVSTLRLVLEAAATHGKEVIVADRPVPLPRVVDGPVTREDCVSFVSLVPAPLAYGMTPGETARWLRRELDLDLCLRVARMTGYRRQAGREPDWPPWVPPSPAMLSWESARCYPATVCFEAFAHLDHGRGTRLPFQVVGGRWIRGQETCEALAAAGLGGVRFYPHRYAAAGARSGIEGVRIVVTDPHRFRPAAAAVVWLCALRDLYGSDRLWRRSAVRPAFFDRLFGTTEVRQSLLDGEPAGAIVARWRPELGRFRRRRERALLYRADRR